jgi:hypothetical protein
VGLLVLFQHHLAKVRLHWRLGDAGCRLLLDFHLVDGGEPTLVFFDAFLLFALQLAPVLMDP